MTAIVVPDLGGEAIEASARRHLARPDGVVLYIALAQHEMRIATGPQARELLSDEAALRILDDRVRPLLREGRTDDGVDAGVLAIEDALRVPSSRRVAADGTIAGVMLAAIVVLIAGAFALGAGRRTRKTRASAGDAYVPVHVDAGSGSSGFSGDGGATSSW